MSSFAFTNAVNQEEPSPDLLIQELGGFRGQLMGVLEVLRPVAELSACGATDVCEVDLLILHDDVYLQILAVVLGLDRAIEARLTGSHLHVNGTEVGSREEFGM